MATASTTPICTYVNGVFKGGGAKGAAYAGALQAAREQGIWFGSVAGASAGAITATLVAAGLEPDEVAVEAPKALQAAHAYMPRRLVKAAVGQATSMFESRGLRVWLNNLLLERTGRKATDEHWVTFQELFDAHGIELYVVVMDLATLMPTVFSRRTTPHVEVAGAVCASSAIPGAFPAGRAIFNDHERGAVTHQMVDGGAYANYPSFVFEDSGFRNWLRIEAREHVVAGAEEVERWRAEGERPVMGFILGHPRPMEHRNAAAMVPVSAWGLSRRFDLGPTYTSPQSVPFIFGSILSSDWARLFIGLSMVIWTAMSFAMLPVGLRSYASWLDGLPLGPVFPVVFVASVVILVLAAVAAIGIVLVLLIIGRLIADTVLPSVKALMGVPTDVPPWIGMGDSSVVLTVPHEGLSTTEFNVPEDRRNKAVQKAYEAVREQLVGADSASRVSAILGRGEVPALEQLPPGPPPGVSTLKADRVSLSGLIVAAVIATSIGGLGWWAANEAGVSSLWRIVAIAVLGIVTVSAALIVLAKNIGARASSRAGRGVKLGDNPSWLPVVLAAAGGAAALVIGLLVSQSAMNERDETTEQVRVTASAIVAGENHYTVAKEAGSKEITTERHLRLGERVFVGERDGSLQLVGAIDDSKFAVAVALTLFGLGLLASATKRGSWIVRGQRVRRLIEPERSHWLAKRE